MVQALHVLVGRRFEYFRIERPAAETAVDLERKRRCRSFDWMLPRVGLQFEGAAGRTQYVDFEFLFVALPDDHDGIAGEFDHVAPVHVNDAQEAGQVRIDGVGNDVGAPVHNGGGDARVAAQIDKQNGGLTGVQSKTDSGIRSSCCSSSFVVLSGVANHLLLLFLLLLLKVIPAHNVRMRVVGTLDVYGTPGVL